MLTSLIALSLAFAPTDLDLSPRRQLDIGPATPAQVQPPVGVNDVWVTPPMVSAEGRTARLLSEDQLARIKAIDEQLAGFNTLPTRALTIVGGAVASAPVAFAAGYAVFFVAELAIKYTAFTLIFSVFTYPAGVVVGLMLVPLWAWGVAAIGLGVALVAGLATSSAEANRNALLAERRALIDSTKPAPVEPSSLITVGTF